MRNIFSITSFVKGNSVFDDAANVGMFAHSRNPSHINLDDVSVAIPLFRLAIKNHGKMSNLSDMCWWLYGFGHMHCSDFCTQKQLSRMHHHVNCIHITVLDVLSLYQHCHR
ncbi:unnamed protein product [Albugo candida]|uniref:Uncharacterized protein n=1 Tax=Albugo candida TaxID=65357 RepID=A0A024FWX8_9STRA|nr:unnamed protein product [Albugo candida]|eukprot:CCI11169.1 unnamed protein product [Albugo candida]